MSIPTRPEPNRLSSSWVLPCAPWPMAGAGDGHGREEKAVICRDEGSGGDEIWAVSEGLLRPDSGSYCFWLFFKKSFSCCSYSDTLLTLSENIDCHVKYACFLYDNVEIITCYSMGLLRWRAQLTKAYYYNFFLFFFLQWSFCVVLIYWWLYIMLKAINYMHFLDMLMLKTITSFFLLVIVNSF